MVVMMMTTMMMMMIMMMIMIVIMMVTVTVVVTVTVRGYCSGDGDDSHAHVDEALRRPPWLQSCTPRGSFMTGDWRSIASLCGVFTDSFASRCRDVERFTRFLSQEGITTSEVPNVVPF